MDKRWCLDLMHWSHSGYVYGVGLVGYGPLPTLPAPTLHLAMYWMIMPQKGHGAALHFTSRLKRGHTSQ